MTRPDTRRSSACGERCSTRRPCGPSPAHPAHLADTTTQDHQVCPVRPRRTTRFARSDHAGPPGLPGQTTQDRQVRPARPRRTGRFAQPDHAGPPGLPGQTTQDQQACPVRPRRTSRFARSGHAGPAGLRVTCWCSGRCPARRPGRRCGRRGRSTRSRARRPPRLSAAAAVARPGRREPTGQRHRHGGREHQQREPHQVAARGRRAPGRPDPPSRCCSSSPLSRATKVDDHHAGVEHRDRPGEAQAQRRA